MNELRSVRQYPAQQHDGKYYQRGRACKCSREQINGAINSGGPCAMFFVNVFYSANSFFHMLR
jgi:hypothetical protein